VVVGSPVNVAGCRWVIGDLAEGDDPRRATIDAKGTTCANVVVDYEDGAIHGVDSRELGPNSLINYRGREQEDAFPRADVDTTLTDDALRLVDVDELLRLDGCGQVVGVYSLKHVVVSEIGKRRVRVSFGHDQLSLTNGRP